MDKKIAILLMVHNINSQLDQFINSFNPNLFDIYIHVDKKVKNINELKKYPNLKLLDTRIDITWSHISQVEVQMLLLHESYKGDKYSHYVLISGQDLPIKNTDYIYKFFVNFRFIHNVDE